METNIEKQGGKWKVTFTHGVQSFTIDFKGTKKECQWIKDRLDECFSRAFAENVSKQQALPILDVRHSFIKYDFIIGHYNEIEVSEEIMKMQNEGWEICGLACLPNYSDKWCKEKTIKIPYKRPVNYA